MVIQWPFWMWLAMWVMFLLTGLVLLTLRRLIDGLQDDVRDLNYQLSSLNELVNGQAIVTSALIEDYRVHGPHGAGVPDANN